ncbi:MAG: carbohydrate kinase family protein [Xanthobacteraceae bacterium]
MDELVQPFDMVTVFGGATLDRIARTAGPPVMGASNPGTVARLPGGVGFNVASILARLGLHARLVTRVGADSDGETVIAAARDAGIDTTAFGVSPTAATAGYHAVFDDAGNLVIGVADMKVCDEITPAALAELALVRHDRDFWVVDANLPAETLAFLAEEANAAGRPIAALTVSPAKAVRIAPLLDRLSYLFTNRREAAALLGRDPNAQMNVADLASALAGPRLTKVVVTNGAEPLAAASGGDVRSFAAFRASVKGVNGAGDSFAAGTIHGLAGGLALNDAIRFGLAAAALTLESGSIAAGAFAKGALAARIGAATRRIAS